MGLPELRSWGQANLDAVSSATFGLTLRQAIAVGHDEAVAEILNAPAAGLTVGRGVLDWPTFNAEFTPTMDAALSAGQRNWLQGQRVAEGGINVSAPAAKAVLDALGFATERPASAAEAHLGRRVAIDQVATFLQRVAVRREQRKVCEADGTISVVLLEDGVEVAREPHPDGFRITDPAKIDVNLTERQILDALNPRRTGG